jgi:DNA mismatch repair protein MutS2
VKYFPASAPVQLEFEKIKELLSGHCRTAQAQERTASLRVHTRHDYITRELSQTAEYLQLLQSGQYFPADFVQNISRELKLLGIEGAVLTGEEFLAIAKLAENIQQLFRWFDAERRNTWRALFIVMEHTRYEKEIKIQIEKVLDDNGVVKDNASADLLRIRQNLYKKRTELRRSFDRIIQKLNKSGYLADIQESFLNGRKVVAVMAEQKRMVRGILHGQSDTGKTTFIEPEETIELNNELFLLENDERAEVYRILKQLAATLAAHATLLLQWYIITGEYDFIRAKARLAADMNAQLPAIHEKSGVHLVNAYHPLLLMYNKKTGKPTLPVSITLNENEHILVISGPNAGGKTVTLKTVGLLQLMVQSGLLIPADPISELGIFKQLLIHIGDTQSIEFELSTYSAHLGNMKQFMEVANGRTLFFIDELGSGSDPGLGGAFAEVIMEELAHKHAYGIVTTHYLNLKVMAGKVKGIINGAMAFDEKKLEPLYRLLPGKPGSSYTFSIAERIGLPQRLIDKARKLANDDQFLLDKLLNRTEQDLRNIEVKDKELQQLLKQNKHLEKEMTGIVNREKHKQQLEILQQQNKVKEEQLLYLKDMERKLKQIVHEWKKSEDKNDALRQAELLLFKQQKQQVNRKLEKKLASRYTEISGDIQPGNRVKLKKNHQVGIVNSIRGKKAIVQVGLIPITVDIENLVLVKENPSDTPS